jgi:S-formylglutathione hydrolase FrmB
VAAIGLAIAGWRGDHQWRRVLSIAAVPLTLLYAANLINQYYGYEPTLGALFDSDVAHQVPTDALGLANVDGGDAGATTDGRATTVGTSNVALTPADGTATADSTTGGTTGDTSTGVGVGSSPASSGPPPSVGIPKVSHRPGHGAVARVDIPGTISGFHARTAWVWVPPAFFDTPRPQLSVVVMLAGVPGQPDNMIRAASADRTADAYAAAHGGIAPILVLPDANGSFTGDTECVDGPRGQAETYLTQDVPNFVTKAFSSATGPSHWAMAGYSEGGTCAMVVTMRNPGVYGTFVDISGDPYPNVGLHGDARSAAITGLYQGDAAQFDAHDPTKLVARPDAAHVAAWFETGTADRSARTVAVQLDAAFRAHGIDSHLVETPGGHDFPMAVKAVQDSFGWLAGRVGS